MIGKHVLAGALASTLLATMALPAAGGNDWHDGSRGYSPHGRDLRGQQFGGHAAPGHGHPDSRKLTRSIGYTSPVTRVRGVGTFSRSVWVINTTENVDRPRPAPKATIIKVDDRYFRHSDPCSYESGVCVIRAAD